MCGGRSSLICCVGDGRGRVGETLGRNTLQAFSQDGGFGRTIVSRSCTFRVQPWSAVLTRTSPNQALESPLSPAPWEAGRAPTPWSGTPFTPPVACPAGLASRGRSALRGRSCSQSRPRWRVAPRPSLMRSGSAEVTARPTFASRYLDSRWVAPGQPGRPLHTCKNIP